MDRSTSAPPLCLRALTGENRLAVPYRSGPNAAVLPRWDWASHAAGGRSSYKHSAGSAYDGGWRRKERTTSASDRSGWPSPAPRGSLQCFSGSACVGRAAGMLEAWLPRNTTPAAEPPRAAPLTQLGTPPPDPVDVLLAVKPHGAMACGDSTPRSRRICHPACIDRNTSQRSQRSSLTSRSTRKAEASPTDLSMASHRR
jgi:hypothetical protein